MALFSFRLKDGNTVIIYAQDEPSAREALREMGQQDTVATVREIKNFVARFSLTDSGDLHTTLLHPGTLNEMAADYPFLQAAKSHSFVDFEARARMIHQIPCSLVSPRGSISGVGTNAIQM